MNKKSLEKEILACGRNGKIEHEGTAQGWTKLRRAHLWRYVARAREIRIVYQSGRKKCGRSRRG